MSAQELGGTRDRKLATLAVLTAAAWPLADVVAANRWDEAPWLEMAAWYAAVLSGLFASVGTAYLLLGRFDRAAAVVMPLALLFFSYALIAPGFSALETRVSSAIGPFLLFVIFFSVVAVWLVRASRDAGTVRLILLAPPFLLTSTCILIGAKASFGPPLASATYTATRFSYRPNVYHFLFDGMGRRETIQAKLGFDVGEVEGSFRSLGFYVPADVVAQYPTTWQSIDSLMNGGRTDGRMEMPDIAKSYAVRTFKSNGYAFARYGEVFKFAACTGEEQRCLSGRTVALSEFSIAMLQRTPLFTVARALILSGTSSRFLNHNLLSIAHAGAPRPTFTFSYMVPPHPPFIFAKDCTTDSKDYNDFRGWAPLSAGRYVFAYRCVVKAVSAAIEYIIARDPSAIIIVSGDHGTMFGQVGATRDGWTAGVMSERLPVFVAIRAPASCQDRISRIARLSEVYPTIFRCLSA